MDFWILYVSSILISITLFTPFVFLADYIDTVGGTGSAAVLLGLIGMSSIAGRLGFGAVAARIGITGLYQLSFLVLSLSVLLWIVADTSYSLLILFAVVLGFWARKHLERDVGDAEERDARGVCGRQCVEHRFVLGVRVETAHAVEQRGVGVGLPATAGGGRSRPAAPHPHARRFPRRRRRGEHRDA